MKIIRSGGEFDGRSIEDITAKWWQWAVHLPDDANPFEDLTGGFARLGDRGDLFFAAGVGGNTDNDPDPSVATVIRSFTVEEDQLLLVPVINWMSNLPTRQERLDEVDLVKSFITHVSAEIDGKAVRGLSADSDKFYFQSDDFKISPIGEDETGSDLDVFALPAGEKLPAIAAGFYLPIEDLREGKHTIHFSAGADFNDDQIDDFALNITLLVTVLDEDCHRDRRNPDRHESDHHDHRLWDGHGPDDHGHRNSDHHGSDYLMDA